MARAPAAIWASILLVCLVALAPVAGCGWPARPPAVPAGPPARPGPGGPSPGATIAEAGGWSAYLTPTPVPQGGLATLVVVADGPVPLRRVSADFLDTPLRFGRRGGAFVALVGIGCGDAPGQYPVHLQVTDGRGRPGEDSRTLTITARRFPRQYLTVTQTQQDLVTNDALWEEDRAQVGRAKSQSAPQPLWAGAFHMPVDGEVTTAYGFLRYVNGQVEGQHSGLDLACDEGTPVLAAAAGVVALSATLNITGETVILDHGLGLFSSYCHLSERLVEVGQSVQAGDVLGRVGATGFATGPHLHWSTTVGSVAIDPHNLLAGDPLEAAPLPHK